MGERARRWLARARWIATPVFVAVLLVRVDPRAVWSRLSHLEPRFVVFYLALSSLLYLLSAWRWQFTSARLGATLPFRRAYLDYYLSTLLNQVLPVGIAGDVVRAARHRERLGGASWGPPARAVVLERFSGVVALALFVLGSSLVWLVRGNGAFLGVFAGALVLVLALPVLWFVTPYASRSPRLQEIARDARAALLERGAPAFQLAVSTASVALLVLMFCCAGRAAGVALDPAAAMQVVPLVLAATTLPWAFAGWGAREACTAALFALMGLDAALGVAVSVTFGVLSLVAALPGLVVFFLPQREER
jgi:uncharacterized membrane protein YbhN (UPF0104 family)